MATKLKTFDFTLVKPKRPKPTYFWDDWFDGDIWQLEEGVDFDIDPMMMERITRTRATSRGAKVRLRHVSDNGSRYVVMQRTDIVGPNEVKAQARREKYAANRKANGTNGHVAASKVVPKTKSRRRAVDTVSA